MWSVLRNPTYAKLFCAQVIALLGTGLLTVALGLLAFDIATDAAGSVLGTALTIKMIAYVGVAPLIAALVDRLPKKAVLVSADLVRLAIALTLPLVTQPWQVYALVFVLQSASATFTPAFQSLIPAVLPEARQYTRALSLSRLAYDLESLLSPMIAAALLSFVAYNFLFVGTAAGFAISTSLVLASRLPHIPNEQAEHTFWQRVPLGVQVFARTDTLRFLMLANVVAAVGTSLVLVNSVVYARGVYHLGDTALAITLACFGVGSLLAAPNIPWILERFTVVHTMLVGAAIVTAALLSAVIVTAAAPRGAGWGWLLATWTLLGLGTSLVSTPSSRLLADASTAKNRNLVYTAQFALSHACFLFAYPIAGWIGSVSLLAAAAVLAGLALLATVAATIFALRRNLRTASDETLTQPEAGATVLRKARP
ncbi:MFS transporter [Gephyromycinifex aptenodytis]|uniref:MFS transporter n=1 Tax=Gephyromycinifex aptenodytis TaxID=2716227 RepID=UPI0014452CE5|nr:MFS transporter [Gephyromycinifex aptenodytis]